MLRRLSTSSAFRQPHTAVPWKSATAAGRLPSRRCATMITRETGPPTAGTGSVFPEQYEELLQEKIGWVRGLFDGQKLPEIEVFRSRPEHFRMRTGEGCVLKSIAAGPDQDSSYTIQLTAQGIPWLLRSRLREPGQTCLTHFRIHAWHCNHPKKVLKLVQTINTGNSIGSCSCLALLNNILQSSGFG